MEIPRSADQRPSSSIHHSAFIIHPSSPSSHPALRLLAARPDLFARQGYIAATWRRRNGKTFGPYHLLCYREGGRLRSVYLGRAGQLVDHVRQELQKLQHRIVQCRTVAQFERRIRRSLRLQKISLSALLRPLGLRLKGMEIRGWRFAPIRFLLPRRLSPRLSPQHRARRRRKPFDPKARLLRFIEARDALLETTVT